MVTVGNMMAQVVKSKVQKSDPVSKAMYKQFKQVSEMTPAGLKGDLNCSNCTTDNDINVLRLCTQALLDCGIIYLMTALCVSIG